MSVHAQELLDTEPSPLARLFAPRRVALIGASEKPRSVGEALWRNLQDFQGSLFPINPKHPSIGGRLTYPNIGDLPQPVDLAIIATPADTVPQLIRECGRAGTSAAIVISAGFRETGVLGVEREAACIAEARRWKVRFLGPNCLGLAVPHKRLNATFAAGTPSPGNIAFLSQSGALCTAALDWSIAERVGFSAFVSVGSMADVGWDELLTHFGSDPNTNVIVCYMESIGDAHSFLAAASNVSHRKPIIALKVGHTESGAKAAASHTGALTGKDSILDAAFTQAGVLRVNTLSELFSLVELASKIPIPKGPRLTIITNAGGPGALAADALSENGGQLTKLSPQLRHTLNLILPRTWSKNNPIDLLGNASARNYSDALNAVLRSGESDALLVILTPQAMTQPLETAEALCAAARRTDQPLLACWMGGSEVAPGKSLLNAAGLPTFDFPDAATKAFAQLWQCRKQFQISQSGIITHRSAPLSKAGQIAVQKVRDCVGKTGQKLLNHIEATQILSAYGIPVLPARAALTEDEAVEGAITSGFPVAIKLLSDTVTHKSDVSGVKLNVTSPADVRKAWAAIQSEVSRHRGSSAFKGVSIQPMLSHAGYELILGAIQDPQFGSLILFGSGGVLTEVYNDTALGIPPLNPTQIQNLIERTRIFAALKGVRGQPGVHLGALTDLILRFSQLVMEQNWIKEIDINPLCASATGCIALDCRMLLQDGTERCETSETNIYAPTNTGAITSCKCKD